MSYYYDDRMTPFVGCIFIIILCVIFGALGGLIFMLLWNWLVPLFWTSAPILSFWQAWGCMILLSIIGKFFKNNSSK